MSFFVGDARKPWLAAATDKGLIGSPAWSGVRTKPAQQTPTAIDRKSVFALTRAIHHHARNSGRDAGSQQFGLSTGKTVVLQMIVRIVELHGLGAAAVRRLGLGTG